MNQSKRIRKIKIKIKNLKDIVFCFYANSIFYIYIGAVELSVPVAFPSVVSVMFDDPVSIVVEPASLPGIVDIWAVAVVVKVPPSKEAVARILAIANKYILFMHLAIVFYLIYLLPKTILYFCYMMFI